jgi:hypothetical protein
MMGTRLAGGRPGLNVLDLQAYGYVILKTRKSPSMDVPPGLFRARHRIE